MAAEPAPDITPDMTPLAEPGTDETMTEPAEPVIMPAGPTFQTLPDPPPLEEDKGDETADAEAGGEPPGESPGESDEASGPPPEEPPQEQD